MPHHRPVTARRLTTDSMNALVQPTSPSPCSRWPCAGAGLTGGMVVLCFLCVLGCVRPPPLPLHRPASPSQVRSVIASVLSVDSVSPALFASRDCPSYYTPTTCAGYDGVNLPTCANSHVSSVFPAALLAPAYNACTNANNVRRRLVVRVLVVGGGEERGFGTCLASVARARSDPDSPPPLPPRTLAKATLDVRLTRPWMTGHESG